MEITVTGFYDENGKSISEILFDSFDLFVKSAIATGGGAWPLPGSPKNPQILWGGISGGAECTQK
jgi:hypothetical protein